jgi:hypothetical protein
MFTAMLGETAGIEAVSSKGKRKPRFSTLYFFWFCDMIF